jgi:uncharacterized membrane protein YhaH (DUF805 family)
MAMLSAFFLGHGRINRGQWLFRLIVLGVLCAAFGLLAREVAGETAQAVFAAIFIWGGCALSTQRLHDIGRAGLSLVILLIPVLGPIWVLLLMLRKGGEGNNRYGADPMARHDYLKVDISRDYASR